MDAGDGKRVRLKRGRLAIYVTRPCWVILPPDMDLMSAYFDVIIDGDGEIVYVHMPGRPERKRAR